MRKAAFKGDNVNGRALVYGVVARCISLLYSGRYKAPRLIMLDGVCKADLRRADNDNNDLTTVHVDADLVAQLAMLVALGVKLPNPLHFVPGISTVLHRAAATLERFQTAIKAIADTLIADGLVGSGEFDMLARAEFRVGRPRRKGVSK